MITYGSGVLLLFLAFGLTGLTLLVITGSAILSSLKTAEPARVPKSTSDAGGVQLRKTEQNPNIVCLLPIFEEKRPEARLW